MFVKGMDCFDAGCFNGGVFFFLCVEYGIWLGLTSIQLSIIRQQINVIQKKKKKKKKKSELPYLKRCAISPLFSYHKFHIVLHMSS